MIFFSAMEGLPTDIYRLILNLEPESASALFATCTTLRRSVDFRKNFLVDLLAKEMDTSSYFDWFGTNKSCFESVCNFMPPFWMLSDFKISPFAATIDNVVTVLLPFSHFSHVRWALENVKDAPVWPSQDDPNFDTLALVAIIFEAEMKKKHHIYRTQVLSGCTIEQLWRLFAETYRRKRIVESILF